MRISVLAALAALMVLSACATVRSSRVNPLNWFGRGEERAVAVDMTQALDPRPLVQQVTAMQVDRAPGGAIVSATGLPPSQGHWEAELVETNDGKPVDGVLTLHFRAYPPEFPRPAGTPASREITAGIFLSTQDLEGVSRIVVQGAENQRVSRR